MAFRIRDLTVLAYANGFTLWTYKTTDSVETMSEAGYWNAAFDNVREGDMFLVTTTEEDGSDFGSIWMVDHRFDGVVEANQKTGPADVA